MSQQLLLDISGASARSKGQARRRYLPSPSEEARKAQRNLARRERARYKKTGNANQHVLSSGQVLPYADPPLIGPLILAKDKAAQKSSEMPLLPHFPAFTVMPTHAHSTNLRALAQSTKYIAAQAKAQQTKTTVQKDIQQVDDVDAVLAQCGFGSRPTPEGEDLDAADMLIDFAKDQYAVFTANDNETLPVSTNSEVEADSIIEYPHKCPVPNCEHHLQGFSLKSERDEHVIEHLEGGIKRGWGGCCGIVSSGSYFTNAEQLRNHVRKWHPWDEYQLKCWLCYCDISKSAYLDHLDDCIIHTVELEALGKARPCPRPSCKHRHSWFASKSDKMGHMIQHYWGLVCCHWCPQSEALYPLDEFRNHVFTSHTLDLSQKRCSFCDFKGNGIEFLQHLNICLVVKAVEKAWSDP